MDDAMHRLMMEQFIKMLARPDLRCEFPDQFEKHWENQGRSGIVRIFQSQLEDQPCDVTFSLFFSGDEVIQTGVRIVFKERVLVNVVHKGDILDFKNIQRIDPLSFLRQNYGGGGEAGVSYALAIDDDAEPQVFRAVECLSGKSTEELKEHWRNLLQANPTRPGKDRVSPIIKSWLKLERDRIDMMFLRDAHLLLPRTQPIHYFQSQGRKYTVVCTQMHGKIICDKIDQNDPEWWGGAFYQIVNGRLERIPHDAKDRLLVLRSYDADLDFPVEEIYVNSRHIYSVLFVGDQAIVWRTRDQVIADVAWMSPQPASRPMEKLMSRFKKKPAEESAAVEVAEAAPAVHPFFLAKAEKTYMEALRAKSPDLNDRRTEYLKLLYDSDRIRYYQNPEALKKEVAGAVTKALKKDAPAIQKEAALLGAHITIMYAEMG